MRAVILLCLLHAAFAIYNPWDGPGPETANPDPNAANACHTDQGSCGCCLIMQEVYKLKKNFNDTLASLEKEYLQTKQSLSNLEASRTAFSVALFNDDQFQCVGPFLFPSTIIYKHVFLNLGGNYNLTSGVFTASRSGVYTFVATVFSDAGSPGSLLAACASLQVNGQAVASASERNRDDQEDSSTISLVLQLKAGDKVTVGLPPSCFLCDNNSYFNTFSGFLLYSTE